MTDDRRPGLESMIQKLHKENPRWSSNRLKTEAKALLTNPTMQVMKNGVMHSVPNPHYRKEK